MDAARLTISYAFNHCLSMIRSRRYLYWNCISLMASSTHDVAPSEVTIETPKVHWPLSYRIQPQQPKASSLQSYGFSSTQAAPKACSAALNSLTAVEESSKFNAEIAHFACFVAAMMESSSSLNGPCDDSCCCGGGPGAWAYGFW